MNNHTSNSSSLNGGTINGRAERLSDRLSVSADARELAQLDAARAQAMVEHQRERSIQMRVTALQLAVNMTVGTGVDTLNLAQQFAAFMEGDQ